MLPVTMLLRLVTVVLCLSTASIALPAAVKVSDGVELCSTRPLLTAFQASSCRTP